MNNDFSYTILEYINNAVRNTLIRPLNLGGISASGGGSGTPPGGFVGYLPQTRVGYDLSEIASNGLPVSGWSLLDNLNHIRYDIDSINTTLSGGVGGGHIIYDEGSILPQQDLLNFTGAGVTVTDGVIAGSGATIVTIPKFDYIIPEGETLQVGATNAFPTTSKIAFGDGGVGSEYVYLYEKRDDCFGIHVGVVGDIFTGGWDAAFDNFDIKIGDIDNTEHGNYLDITMSGFAFNGNVTISGGLQVQSDTEANMLFLDASADTLQLGGTTNSTTVAKGGSLSQAGTARINWAKKTAASVTIAAGGTDASSVVANLQTENDGNIFHLDEASATPAIDFYVEFTSITAFNWVQIRAEYVGSSTHAIGILLYDWVAGAWKHKNALQDGEYDTTAQQEVIANLSFFVPTDTVFIGTGGNAGKVRVRFVHPAAGSAAHDLYVDVVALYQ